MPLNIGDREVRFHPIVELDGAPVLGRVVECAECGALVRRDNEGYAESNHEQFHRDVWAMLRALRYGKADAC